MEDLCFVVSQKRRSCGFVDQPAPMYNAARTWLLIWALMLAFSAGQCENVTNSTATPLSCQGSLTWQAEERAAMLAQPRSSELGGKHI